MDVEALRDRLALCRGQMSAVIVAKTDPATVIIVKGNKPLELAYHQRLRAAFYASSGKYLQAAVPNAADWQHMPLKPMTICVINCSGLTEPRRILFDFQAQAKAMTPKGVMTI